jgi:hypothetical protein
MQNKHKYGTHCIICKLPFAESGSKMHNSKGKCKSCYGIHLRANGFTECQICGRKLTNKQAKPNCKMCKLKVLNGMIETEKFKMNKRYKYYSNYSNKVCERFNLTENYLNKIRILLILFKHKLTTEVDTLKVANIYTEIWGIDSSLDSFDVETQVHFMVKRLDTYYHKNKSLIYK